MEFPTDIKIVLLTLIQSLVPPGPQRSWARGYVGSIAAEHDRNAQWLAKCAVSTKSLHLPLLALPRGPANTHQSLGGQGWQAALLTPQHRQILSPEPFPNSFISCVLLLESGCSQGLMQGRTCRASTGPGPGLCRSSTGTRGPRAWEPPQCARRVKGQSSPRSQINMHVTLWSSEQPSKWKQVFSR